MASSPGAGYTPFFILRLRVFQHFNHIHASEEKKHRTCGNITDAVFKKSYFGGLCLSSELGLDDKRGIAASRSTRDPEKAIASVPARMND